MFTYFNMKEGQIVIFLLHLIYFNDLKFDNNVYNMLK